HWGRLAAFVQVVLLPYLVGGLGPGLLAAGAAYFLSHPLIVAYQKQRIKRQKARFEKKRVKEARRASKILSRTTDPAE
ncbi:MAG: hypothetical protein AAGJ39_13910, partial [Pseudomonadota bacterium]